MCGKYLLSVTSVNDDSEYPTVADLCLGVCVTLNQVTLFFLLNVGNPFTTGHSMHRKQCGARAACGCQKPMGAFCSSRMRMLTRLPFAPHAQTWEPPCVQVLLLGHRAAENRGVLS